MKPQNSQPPQGYLLTIPTEILEKILKHLLLRRNRIIPVARLAIFRSDAEDFRSVIEERIKHPEKKLAVARTCKRIHTEACRVWFSYNIFSFASAWYSM